MGIEGSFNFGKELIRFCFSFTLSRTSPPISGNFGKAGSFSFGRRGRERLGFFKTGSFNLGRRGRGGREKSKLGFFRVGSLGKSGIFNFGRDGRAGSFKSNFGGLKPLEGGW